MQKDNPIAFKNIFSSVLKYQKSVRQISTSNHMFKREIWDKFQKMNEVNFPQIS